MAGEPSGDVLGARLMAALKTETGGHVRFAGVGGPLMAAEGLESLFPIADIALMGIAEVVPKIPLVLRRVRETARHARALAPQVMVTIDVPGFSGRLADRLAARTFPLVHYVAPTVWAWRAGRARKLARRVDHLLTLLPFEPPWFEREGLPATFVGHPVVESGVAEGDGQRFRRNHGLAAEQPLLCLLPGSRHGEVARLLPVFGAVVAGLAARHRDLRLVVPTLPGVEEPVRAAVAGWPLPSTIVMGDADKYDAFAASLAALAASGTVSLELAIARVPHVIAYAVSPLTAMIARQLIRVRHASLVNILEDRPVVPEFIQERCTPPNILPAMSRLLDDPAARLDQRDVGAKIARQLGGPGAGLSPSRAAARVIGGLLAGQARRGRPHNHEEDGQ